LKIIQLRNCSALASFFLGLHSTIPDNESLALDGSIISCVAFYFSNTRHVIQNHTCHTYNISQHNIYLFKKKRKNASHHQTMNASIDHHIKHPYNNAITCAVDCTAKRFSNNLQFILTFLLRSASNRRNTILETSNRRHGRRIPPCHLLFFDALHIISGIRVAHYTTPPLKSSNHQRLFGKRKIALHHSNAKAPSG
jgi:hypothetical protein